MVENNLELLTHYFEDFYENPCTNLVFLGPLMRILMPNAQFRQRGPMRTSRSHREGRVPNVGVSDTGFQKLMRNLARGAKC